MKFFDEEEEDGGGERWPFVVVHHVQWALVAWLMFDLLALITSFICVRTLEEWGLPVHYIIEFG